MNNKQVTDIANLYKSIYEEEGVKAYASIQSEATMAPREHKKPTPTVPSTNPKPKDPPKGTSLGPKDVRMESMVGGRGLPSPSGGSSTGPNLLNRAVDTVTSVVKTPVQRQANKKYGPLGGVVAGGEVDKIGSDVKSGNYGGALNRTVSGLGKLFNSTDLFDIVKGHLIDEGYADTEEAALAIMANMSEEWRKSIIEEVDSQGNRSHDLFTDKPNPNYKPGNRKPKPSVKKEPPMRDEPLW